MKSMTREEMQIRARELINRKDNEELRELLYHIHTGNFDRMLEIQSEEGEFREMSPVKAFNTGMEVGKYSGLFELLTGMTVSELEKTEKDIMQDVMKTIVDLSGSNSSDSIDEARVNKLKKALNGAESVIVGLHKLLSSVKGMELLVKSDDDRKAIQSAINDIMKKRDFILPDFVVENIHRRLKKEINIAYGKNMERKLKGDTFSTFTKHPLFSIFGDAGFDPSEVMDKLKSSILNGGLEDELSATDHLIEKLFGVDSSNGLQKDGELSEAVDEYMKNLFPELYKYIKASDGKMPLIVHIKDLKPKE
jgi:hypothetical protein